MTWGFFSPAHIVSMILAVAQVVALYLILKNKSQKVQLAVLVPLSFSGIAAIIYKLVSWGEPLAYLPLHLCSLNAMVLPFAVIRRNKTVCNLLLVWSLGAFIAILLNQDVMDQVGKEYRADGIEISAHALCAKDHLPYQGRQYSKKDFERIQNNLERPFGMWNCKHTMFPILLGISPPAHSEEELAQYAMNSNAEITIDGITMSRYEWTQQQRRIETRVRAQKDIAVAAKAQGDMTARREAQRNINALQAQYEKISKEAGLIQKPERMSVAGFRQVKTAEQLKKKTEHTT